MWQVAKIDNGAKVNTSKSLLLSAEIRKITTPIKNDAIIFLKDVCNNNGLFESDSSIETTKNKATDT
jgi:hypothetical protein